MVKIGAVVRVRIRVEVEVGAVDVVEVGAVIVKAICPLLKGRRRRRHEEVSIYTRNRRSYGTPTANRIIF